MNCSSIVLCFVLGNQQVALNDCITDTTRYSVRRAGLLFGIKFESNGNRHLVCSPFPQTCSPVLGSYQVLAHLKMAWFASSHLLPPPHLLTLPTQGSSTWLAGWLGG